MRTPHDDAWHMIDAGIKASAQMTRKGAANFVRWKFIDDLQRDGVHIATLVVTHSDADHYGGMIDLLSGALPDGRTFAAEVDRFWHCGIGRFKDGEPLGAERADTSTTALPNAGFGVKPAGRFIVELLDGETHFGRPKRPFAADFATLAKWVGKVPKKVSSLSRRDGWLPGYAPAPGAAAIRVLGPVAETLAGGRPGTARVQQRQHHAQRPFGGAARGLWASARAAHRRPEQCVAAAAAGPACGRGIQRRRVQGLPPRQRRCRSAIRACDGGPRHGDLVGRQRGLCPPAPAHHGASARYGRESLSPGGELLPPLLYSTELARSVGLRFAAHARSVADPRVGFKPEQLEADFDASPLGSYKRLSWLPMATDLVYGLVNVRSDGQRILCATMKEGSSDFDLQVFQAGVEAA